MPRKLSKRQNRQNRQKRKNTRRKTMKVGRKRKLTPWQMLVKKIYHENKNKKGYTFGKALREAKKEYKQK